MAISQPYQNLITLAALANTAEQISATYSIHPSSTQYTVLCDMSVAGTLKIDAMDPDGGAHQISSTATVANTLLVVNNVGNVGAIRVRWTPGSSGATGRIDVRYSGMSQPA